MNNRITRIILASAGLAFGSIMNVASGQVLGGGLSNATGTLSGAGSFHGTLNTSQTIERSRGPLGRMSDTARNSGEKIRGRGRNIAGAAKNEAHGAASDIADSATAVSAIAHEEASGTTNAAAIGAEGAAAAAGGIDQESTQQLTNSHATFVPSEDSAEPILSAAPMNNNGMASNDAQAVTQDSLGKELTTLGDGTSSAGGQSALLPQGSNGNAAATGTQNSNEQTAVSRRNSLTGSAQANASAEAEGQASL